MTASAWNEAGWSHSRVLAQCNDRIERLRVLSSAPLFSLWTDCKKELEDAAIALEAARIRIATLEARLKALEGEDA